MPEYHAFMSVQKTRMRWPLAGRAARRGVEEVVPSAWETCRVGGISPAGTWWEAEAKAEAGAEPELELEVYPEAEAEADAEVELKLMSKLKLSESRYTSMIFDIRGAVES